MSSKYEMLKVRVTAIEQATPLIKRFTLSACDGSELPAFSGGSHVIVRMQEGEQTYSNAYSLMSDPRDRRSYQLGVRREEQSKGGSAFLHEQVEVGSELTISTPNNLFALDPAAGHHVLIAGGIGITPLIPMAARARSLGIDYVLHYCGRTRAAMAYADKLRALHGDRLVMHVSEEGTRADVGTLLPTPDAGTIIHACGPQRLLDALEQACAGWPSGALRVEHFHAAAGRPDPALEHAFEAELRDSGLVVQVRADQTLLEALRGVNIDVQSDCGEGLCGSCEVAVIDGSVDHRDLVLTRAERQENRRMMACCSRAAGRRVTLAL